MIGRPVQIETVRSNVEVPGFHPSVESLTYCYYGFRLLVMLRFEGI